MCRRRCGSGQRRRSRWGWPSHFQLAGVCLSIYFPRRTNCSSLNLLETNCMSLHPHPQTLNPRRRCVSGRGRRSRWGWPSHCSLIRLISLNLFETDSSLNPVETNSSLNLLETNLMSGTGRHADRVRADVPAGGGARAARGHRQPRHVQGSLHRFGTFLHPTPYTLHPTPYTPHPTPYTLFPTTHTLHPTPCTLHPTPHTLHLTPCIHSPNSIYSTLKPKPESRKPKAGDAQGEHVRRLRCRVLR